MSKAVTVRHLSGSFSIRQLLKVSLNVKTLISWFFNSSFQQASPGEPGSDCPVLGLGFFEVLWVFFFFNKRKRAHELLKHNSKQDRFGFLLIWNKKPCRCAVQPRPCVGRNWSPSRLTWTWVLCFQQLQRPLPRAMPRACTGKHGSGNRPFLRYCRSAHWGGKVLFSLFSHVQDKTWKEVMETHQKLSTDQLDLRKQQEAVWELFASECTNFLDYLLVLEMVMLAFSFAADGKY